jgi:transposase
MAKLEPKKITNQDLIDYFLKPPSSRQKQYEAIRALVIENKPVEHVAKQFGYTINTIYSLIRDIKNDKHQLFPIVKKGPKNIRTPNSTIEKVIKYRKNGLSVIDIKSTLEKDQIEISTRTITRIIKESGFKKLPRRTNNELGKTTNNKVIPPRSCHIDFSKLKPFSVDCPVAGIFFFLPYIIESGILDVVKQCKLPQSGDIKSTQACLSMLLLKLVGRDRLTHINAYDQEPGLGVFAGLNILPKPTYINTYSCRCSEPELESLQKMVLEKFKEKYPDFYSGKYINLDFHSIPHFGTESEMEKVWCGARGKTLKGATTVFTQDSNSNAILYTRADILRNEEADEVVKFVTYWKKITNNMDETLVFDCKFTTYKILNDLNNDKVKFITLRKRSAKLVAKLLEISDDKWQKVHVPIPKRKYTRVLVYETNEKLNGCQKTFRQIAIKNHGRAQPTFIITNNKTLPLKNILEIYAKRWRIENKFGELVAFFNLNALSSPIMIRIHFDILWTIIADTLYHRFAQDLRRFEKALVPQLFRKFIDMPGKVVYDGEKFIVKIRKRAHTPILMGVSKLQNPIKIPWLEGKTIEIIWTA